MHPAFQRTFEEIKKHKIVLPSKPVSEEIDFSYYSYPPSGNTVLALNEMKTIKLNAEKGQRLSKKTICAYDESLNKFPALEGSAYLFSHSIVK